MKYRIQMKDDHGNWTPASDERFTTEREAQLAIDKLRKRGAKWRDAAYKVKEVTDAYTRSAAPAEK